MTGRRDEQPEPHIPERSHGHRPVTPAPADEGESLKPQLELMKAEIDGLQISAAEKAHPWWRQASSWLAILALVVTLGTAVQQSRLGKAQSELAQDQGTLAAEAELSNVMTRIEAVQRGRADAATLPEAQKNQSTAILNAQSLVWIWKGIDLVDRRDKLANAAEYYALAQAISTQIGPDDRVIKYLRRAVKLAEDTRTYSLAAQVLADTHARRREFPPPTLHSPWPLPRRRN